MVSLHDLPHIPASHPAYGPGPVWSSLPIFSAQCALLSAGMRGTLICHFCGKWGSQGASLLQNLHRNSHLIPTLELSLAAMTNFEDRDNGKQEVFCPEFTKRRRLQSWIFSRKEGRKASGTNTSRAFPFRGDGFHSTPTIGIVDPSQAHRGPLASSFLELELVCHASPSGCEIQALWPRSPRGGEKHCPSTCLCSYRLKKVTGCSDLDYTPNTQTQSEWPLSPVLPWSLRRVTSFIPIPAPAGGLEAPAAV